MLEKQLLEKQYNNKVNLNGKHIYPGFIALNSTLGLVEVDAVRASDDESEIGTFNPNIRSIIAYNAESKIIETMRLNGVLLAQVTPRGGVVSGSSSVVQLDAWNWEDAAQKVDDGIHLNWPAYFVQHGWWAEPGDIEKTDRYSQQIESINHYFQKARSYHQSTTKTIDLELAAMSGLFDASKQLYVHANLVREMTDAFFLPKNSNLRTW